MYADVTNETAAGYKSLLDLKVGGGNKHKERNIRCGIPHRAALIITVGNQTRTFNELAEKFLNNLEKRDISDFVTSGTGLSVTKCIWVNVIDLEQKVCYKALCKL